MLKYSDENQNEFLGEKMANIRKWDSQGGWNPRKGLRSELGSGVVVSGEGLVVSEPDQAGWTGC